MNSALYLQGATPSSMQSCRRSFFFWSIVWSVFKPRCGARWFFLLSLPSFGLVRKQSLLYALAGVGSVAVAIGIAWFLGKSEGFFLPGLISGSMTLLLTIVSLVIRRPMVAWTSYIARRWPLDWYWHPQVRPAYSEVTFAWALFFAARLLLQFSLFENKNVNSLAVTNFITGWPATILLLVFSYLYGTGGLRNCAVPAWKNFATTPQPRGKVNGAGFNLYPTKVYTRRKFHENNRSQFTNCISYFDIDWPSGRFGRQSRWGFDCWSSIICFVSRAGLSNPVAGLYPGLFVTD